MPKSNTAYEILEARASRVGPNVCALAVMTKAPQAGQSKTRLVPPLTTAQAAMLSASFLRDTCENIAASCMNGTAAGVAVYTPVGAESFFDGLILPSFSLLKQRGNLFGDRLFHATEDIFAVGYDSVCLINSDSPTLPSRFLRAAVSALAQPRDQVVLGPARDGGYYLIGLKKSHRHLFEDIDWSTSKVLTQTITRAKEIKLPVTLLGSWFDVDDAATLRRLCDDLFPTNGKHAGPAYRAAHTRAYLARLRQMVHLWENLAELERPTAGESRRCDLRID